MFFSEGCKKLHTDTCHNATGLLADALTRATANVTCAAKRIGRVLGKSERTGHNVLSGAHEIKAGDLIKLMREYDEVWDVVQEMAGRGDGLTEKQRRALAALGPLLEGK